MEKDLIAGYCCTKPIEAISYSIYAISYSIYAETQSYASFLAVYKSPLHKRKDLTRKVLIFIRVYLETALSTAILYEYLNISR